MVAVEVNWRFKFKILKILDVCGANVVTHTGDIHTISKLTPCPFKIILKLEVVSKIVQPHGGHQCCSIVLALVGVSHMIEVDVDITQEYDFVIVGVVVSKLKEV
jgi:hypothetical protein